MQPWQKEQLVQLRLLGHGSQPAVAVGRAAAASPLPRGFEPRLLQATRILCAPEPKALKAEHRLFKRVEAAAHLLLQLFLEASLSGFGLSSEEMAVCLPRCLPTQGRVA